MATRPCRLPVAAARTAAMRKAMVIVALLAANRLGSGIVVRPSQSGPVAQPRAAKADRLNVKQFSAAINWKATGYVGFGDFSFKGWCTTSLTNLNTLDNTVYDGPGILEFVDQGLCYVVHEDWLRKATDKRKTYHATTVYREMYDVKLMLKDGVLTFTLKHRLSAPAEMFDATNVPTAGWTTKIYSLAFHWPDMEGQAAVDTFTMIMCDYKTIADKSTKIKLHLH